MITTDNDNGSRLGNDNYNYNERNKIEETLFFLSKLLSINEYTFNCFCLPIIHTKLFQFLRDQIVFQISITL